MVSRLNNRGAREGEEDANYVFTSTVVISAREQADFGQLLEDQDWSVIESPPDQRVWTDDYSNVIGAVIRQYRVDSGDDDEEEPKTPEPPTKPAQPPESKQ
jgi:hypothetical protein